TRVSVATSGAQHNGVGYTDGPSISGDGRYVVFHSDASNLAAVADTNSSEDVFVRDTAANTTTLLSHTPGGVPGNWSSYGGVISGDGLKVAFTSDASNLVAGDNNAHKDIFVVARTGGSPVRVSLTSAGGQPDLDSFNASISGDGQYIAFISTATNMVFGDTNSVADVFVRDTVANTTTRVSVDSSGAQADGASFGYPVISRDGHSVVFCSDATNLVPGDTNNATDTFVHNLVTHRTVRASVGAAGQQGGLNGGIGFRGSGISSDGRYVGFSSFAGNLVPGDTNNASDAFIRDLGPACPADLGTQGGAPGSDGVLDNNDFIVFIDYFFAHDPLADRGVQGGVPGSDGAFDNNDFIVFIDQFFAGC
ncbi:MAG: GC-type dockerin domain-anchored protein, partial [Phycisphaerales bacterium]|nr:GC-type dockerin domain-anchored protein [Phycisphaerales bacterium]